MKTNQSKKRAIWKEAKLKWLENVPKKYKVNVEGIDEGGQYFHPEIILNDTLKIRAQGDIEHNYIYGDSLDLTQELTYNCAIYRNSLSINDREEFEYLVNNLDDIQPKLMENLKMIEQLYIMKADLDTVQSDIIHNSISKYKDNDRLNRSAKMLYSITEYLENERIIT